MDENKKKPFEDQDSKYTKIKKSSKTLLIVACCLLGVATIATSVVCGVSLANKGSQDGKEELEKKIVELTKQVKEKEAQVTKLTEQITEAEKKVTEAEKKVVEKEKELKEAEAKIETQTTEIEQLKAEIANLKGEIEKYKTAIASLEDDLAQAKKDLEQVKKDLEKALEDLQTEKNKVSLIFMQGNYEDPDLIDCRITPGKSFKDEGLELPKNSQVYNIWGNAYGEREDFDENTIVYAPMILEERNSIKITLEGIPENVYTEQTFEVTATWTGKGVKEDEFEMYVVDYRETYYGEKSINYEISGNTCKITTLTKHGNEVEVGYRHKEIEDIRKSETFTIQELKKADIDSSKFEHDTVKIIKVDPAQITNESAESSTFKLTYTNSGDTISEFDLRGYDKNDEELFQVGTFEAIGDGEEHTVEFTFGDDQWYFISQDTSTIYLKEYQPIAAQVECHIDHPDISVEAYTLNIDEKNNTIDIDYINSSSDSISLELSFYTPTGGPLYESSEVELESGTHRLSVQFNSFYLISSGDTICLVNYMEVNIVEVNIGEDFPLVGSHTSQINNVSDNRKTINCSFNESYSGEGKKVHLVANKYVGEDPAIQVYDFGMVSFDQGITDFELIFDGWKNVNNGDNIRIEVAKE